MPKTSYGGDNAVSYKRHRGVIESCSAVPILLVPLFS
jgi:hypothetical protein